MQRFWAARLPRRCLRGAIIAPSLATVICTSYICKNVGHSLMHMQIAFAPAAAAAAASAPAWTSRWDQGSSQWSLTNARARQRTFLPQSLLLSLCVRVCLCVCVEMRAKSHTEWQIRVHVCLSVPEVAEIVPESDIVWDWGNMCDVGRVYWDLAWCEMRAALALCACQAATCLTWCSPATFLLISSALSESVAVLMSAR